MNTGETTGIPCRYCNGEYIRERHDLVCSNCSHCPPDGDERELEMVELGSRPRYQGSGKVVMCGVVTELTPDMVEFPDEMSGREKSSWLKTLTR